MSLIDSAIIASRKIAHDLFQGDKTKVYVTFLLEYSFIFWEKGK